MKTISAELVSRFEQVAIAHQSLARSIDSLSAEIETVYRNHPETRQILAELRTLCACTVPVACNKLNAIERKLP